MKLLITGASSYVGARLYEDLKKDFAIIGTYNKKKLFPELEHLDILDAAATQALITKHAPEYILHVAAASSTKSFSDEAQATAINVKGTNNVVEAANAIDAKMIFLSSEAVYMNNPYGHSKQEGERIVKLTKSGYIILQLGLVFGLSPNTENDRTFNRILSNLHGTSGVYDAEFRFRPTYIRNISEVVKAIIDRKMTGQTIPIVVDEIRTKYEVASDILRPFGVAVTPSHEQSGELLPFTTEKLRSLQLPFYTYNQMVQEIHHELSHHEPLKIP